MTRALAIMSPAPGDSATGESRFAAALLSIGTAVPSIVQPQREFAERMERLWRLSASKRDRWRRIVAGSGVETRHGVAPIDEVLRATTGERMKLYHRHAPPLAERAARAALDQAGLAPHAVTDLIIVSCTGFVAPGIDVAIVDRLGLAPTVRRNTVGFMGCFGAITGLRAALGAVAAAPGEEDAIALVICVELCSLHLRDSIDDDNLVAAALFGDGAAAAIVQRLDRGRARATMAPLDRAPIGFLSVGGSILASHGRSDMTWRITDSGFAMTIDPSVPRAIETLIPRAVDAAGLSDPSEVGWIVHPGGPRILDAVEASLGLSAGALDPSREVLRRGGNMSSGTVLFVLEAWLRGGRPQADAALLAFGPGLTIELMPLRAVAGNLRAPVQSPARLE